MQFGTVVEPGQEDTIVDEAVVKEAGFLLRSWMDEDAVAVVSQYLRNDWDHNESQDQETAQSPRTLRFRKTHEKH